MDLGRETPRLPGMGAFWKPGAKWAGRWNRATVLSLTVRKGSQDRCRLMAEDKAMCGENVVPANEEVREIPMRWSQWNDYLERIKDVRCQEAKCYNRGFGCAFYEVDYRMYHVHMASTPIRAPACIEVISIPKASGRSPAMRVFPLRWSPLCFGIESLGFKIADGGILVAFAYPTWIYCQWGIGRYFPTY